jgi:hypothetical protein
MRIDPAQLEQGLKDAFPGGSGEQLAALARWVAEAVSGQAPPSEAESAISTDPGLAEAVRQLAGQRVVSGGAVVSFGQGNQFFGNITIGDVAGRDLIKLQVTLFVGGGHEPLKDAYIDPLPVFRSARIEEFERRDWLTARLDAFLDGHDRGYFILEAAAGLGKTAFLADLVRARGYVHLFVEQAPGLPGCPAGSGAWPSS